MDVARVSWPAERDRLQQLRSARTPRLLIVAPGMRPPTPVDCLEDWVRVASDQSELRARTAALQVRARRHRDRPEVDSDGLLRFGDGWVALPPVDAALAAALVERFGTVVARDELARRAWPSSVPTRNALDVHILRLRRRLTPLGLEIRTVRSRGYLLQPAA